MQDLEHVAGPVQRVGGRFAVFASVYRTRDGRLLQGLGSSSLLTDTSALEHAAWRATQGHESDAGKDWFVRDWPLVAMQGKAYTVTLTDATETRTYTVDDAETAYADAAQARADRDMLVVSVTDARGVQVHGWARS